MIFRITIFIILGALSILSFIIILNQRKVEKGGRRNIVPILMKRLRYKCLRERVVFVSNFNVKLVSVFN